MPGWSGAVRRARSNPPALSLSKTPPIHRRCCPLRGRIRRGSSAAPALVVTRRTQLGHFRRDARDSNRAVPAELPDLAVKLVLAFDLDERIAGRGLVGRD